MSKATAQEEPTQEVTCGLALKGQPCLPSTALTPISYKEPDYGTQKPTGQEVTYWGPSMRVKKGMLSLGQMTK